MKMVHLTTYEARSFYKEHEKKPFFESVVNFMCNEPVVVVCLEGENAIKVNREIMGTTNPKEAREGTIRKIFGESIEANAVHGSDSFQSAQREINYFFSEKEIFSRSK
jgi:nucleoside-diphosphate kinase